MKVFSQLKKNLKNDFSQLPTIKIALLGDSATQFLNQALRGTGYDRGYNLDVFEADFNQIEQQIFDPSSELYKFTPDVIVIFNSTHKLLSKYNKLDQGEQHKLAELQIELISNLFNRVKKYSNAKVIYFNFPEINDSVFGSFANKTISSFLYQLRKLNYELMSYAAQATNFYLLDIASIQNQLGKSTMFQPAVYVNSEMVLSIDVLPIVAARIVDIIGAIYGKFKKCLILDLDNTMWGGVIGDDGLENIQLGSLGIGKAFVEFQHWIKKLKNRGIIIAVCSKNTESVAKEPFQKHPDMVLRMEDVALFVANWESKVDNIRTIQKVLNIGFDSMVFLDDNPYERNVVRESIAELTIPELPVDPAEYLEYLYTLNLFETASFSNEDTERTKLYQVEAKRTNLQASFSSEGEFLQSLDMISIVEPFNKFNTPRVAQLSQRSNQFNLRTVRYTDEDIARIANNNNYYTLSFTLKDKFGDNGLIAVVILAAESQSTMFIESWFMSCRVLKRGMENFTLNAIIDVAKLNGFLQIKAEYLPTVKNELVKDHYVNLGFEEKCGYWYLDVENYQTKSCFITKK
ncbi:HAD-IIIC family phosphatase [Mucilaginibacter terrenus]|uniref:HAD-IIIC family phosphatase n=1 Tax=Mucilaginibacter terrenus TaxID=2482727 RepID=A0A3E2NXP3_9SPHI|nr:HAD-IIIC family phosphatase [Mucilaginibacter terrenus]RFZ85788.1 HAD-IIIC family phosphatase [Mucilaginibacter terrenus]